MSNHHFNLACGSVYLSRTDYIIVKCEQNIIVYQAIPSSRHAYAGSIGKGENGLADRVDSFDISYLNTADMDFKSTMTELTFDAERTRVCTCFEILQDTEVEAEEQFSIVLTAANPRLSATATVIIVDDDSEGIQTAHLCLLISVLNLFLEVGQSLFCSDFCLLLPIVALSFREETFTSSQDVQ